MKDVTSNREDLLPDNVDFVRADILDINVKSGIVKTSMGDFKGDHFIIALGADLNMGAISGLENAALSFYSIQDAVELQKKLQDFQKGEIFLLIPRMPIKCPPAPYEAALMMDDYFKQKGNRNNIGISIYTVEPGPMSTAGPEMSNYIRSLIEERNIGYHPLMQTDAVDAERNVVRFSDGSEKKYDLLVAIPPHQAPTVVRNAGLVNAGGWIPVDPKTMKMDAGGHTIPVYAVGDTTAVPLPGRHKPNMPLILPKAGVFAASQGIVAAKQIAAHVKGKPASDEFDGRGYCFIEVGGEEAIKGEGSFFDVPAPQMVRRSPDKKQYRDKANWIDRWSKGVIE